MSWWQHLLLFLFFFPPLGFVGGYCRRRCCNPCNFFEDSFTRADDDTIGNDWSEVSGDGDIASNKLSTSSSNAVFLQSTEHPDGEPNIRVRATVNIATSGDTARIYLNRTDANNYWYAEVKAGTGAYLRIYQVSGGTATQVQGEPITRATGSFPLCASIRNGSYFVANVQVDGGSYISFAQFGSFSSPGWGVGTGSLTGTVTFDDVIASRSDEECPSCSQYAQCTNCSNDPEIAYEMLVEVSGLTNSSCGSCSNNNTAYVTVRDTGQLSIPGFSYIGCTWTARLVSDHPTGVCFKGARFYVAAPGQAPTISTTNYVLLFALCDNVASFTHNWYEILGTTKPDCNFSNVALTNLSGVSSQCTTTSSTCHVTALPSV